MSIGTSKIRRESVCNFRFVFPWRLTSCCVSGSSKGIDIGTIKELIPVERGASGRIMKLKIVGSKTSVIIGKELMIRRSLSETHLKSSAFDIFWEKEELVLKGRGWGHGVGFCQIGAAVMADEGKGYREILQHYYPGATIEKYE